jgi:hypothetical protein
MSADSLAAAPHQCNSVQDELSHLFLLSIQYFHKQPDSETTIFINQLRVLFALSYAACHLVNLSQKQFQDCQKYIDRFIQHSHGDFRRHWGAFVLLANTLASLVLTAIENFHRSHYPVLYRSFIHALGTVLNNPSITQANQAEEMQQLLQTLQQQL